MNLFSFLKKKKDNTSFTCACCGKVYDIIPLCFGSDFPEYYFSIPPNEREDRIELLQSLCVVDEEHFFHRGRLTIPIIDHTEDLIFNVWTSISKSNYDIRVNLWEDPKRIEQKPYFGWLQTIVPQYGETINIKTIAQEQEVGLIPKIISIEEDHPLTIDQENGITYTKALQIVTSILQAQHEAN
ncbi:MAG: DUF2199 domain-containing protein [Filimonas sp.]|nr:DUF2199 domain-containing protein [Filimonas sp.]